MSVTIHLHGPHVFTAELIETPTVFVSLRTGDATLILRTQDDCIALQQAAYDAKILLNGNGEAQ